MAKIGNHHKTTAFGDASEYYASKLFQMGMNPNGNIRPDLIVDPNLHDYSQQFSVELKGGKRGILLRSQLVYGINNMGDWKEFFGKNRRNPFAKNGTTRLFVNEGERVFYGLAQRVDGLSCDDLVGDYAMVRVQWGDLHLLPSELIFHYYAAVLSRKNGERIRDTSRKLKNFVKRSVRAGSSLYDERDNDAWVSLPFSSSKAVFEGNSDGIKNEDQRETLERFFRAARNDTDYDNYTRACLNSVGGSKLFVLHSPKDQKIVDELRETVKRVKPRLDRIKAERDEVKEWIENGGVKLGVRGFDHFYNGGVDETRKRQLIHFYGERYGVDEDKLELLERLCRWENPEEYSDRVRIANAEIENKMAGVPF